MEKQVVITSLPWCSIC